jgi:hypothetical protein
MMRLLTAYHKDSLARDHRGRLTPFSMTHVVQDVSGCFLTEVHHG